MRVVAATVLGNFGFAGVDYVLIAKKNAYCVKWNDLISDVTSAVRFLNNKISKCKES
jgi:hypothetical protein